MYMHACTCVYMHAYASIHMYICVCTHMSVCYICYMHMFHTYYVRKKEIERVCVCMYVCMYTNNRCTDCMQTHIIPVKWTHMTYNVYIHTYTSIKLLRLYILFLPSISAIRHAYVSLRIFCWEQCLAGGMQTNVFGADVSAPIVAAMLACTPTPARCVCVYIYVFSFVICR